MYRILQRVSLMREYSTRHNASMNLYASNICGNVPNVYPLADQVALGCTIFADSATCGTTTCWWYLGLTWLWRVWPDRGRISSYLKYHIGFEIVISGATVNDSLWALRRRVDMHVPRERWNMLWFMIELVGQPKITSIRIEAPIVGDMTFAEWQSSSTYYMCCSNFDTMSGYSEWRLYRDRSWLWASKLYLRNWQAHGEFQEVNRWPEICGRGKLELLQAVRTNGKGKRNDKEPTTNEQPR